MPLKILVVDDEPYMHALLGHHLQRSGFEPLKASNGREAVEVATRGLATELGVKAGEVIAPARVAVTGRKAAPGIFEVLWLVGREGSVARFRAAGGRWQAESPLAAGA